MTDFTNVDVSADADALASRVTDWLEQQLAETSGPYRIALSGGSTPKALFALLAERAARIPWDRLHLFWGDERYVDYSSPDSNYGEARRILLDKPGVTPATVHPMPCTPNPDEAAAAYAALLRAEYDADALDPARPLFDLVFLGLGEDGHTASLIPGQPVLQDQTRWVAAVGHGRPEVRITLTYPALNAAHTIAFLVSGAGKADILQKMREGADVPAAHVKPSGKTIWFVDKPAIRE